VHKSFNNPWVFYGTLIVFAALMPKVMGSYSGGALVLLFGIAAASCNLMLGYAGMLSFAQGAFFGGGSYMAGIVLKTYPGLGLLALVVCALGGVVLALIIGGLSIRQRGIYFIMITLAMAQLAFFGALYFSDWTGGENGLLDIPQPAWLPASWMSADSAQYLLVGIAFVLALTFLRRIILSPFGRVLDAARENEVRALTVGYDVQKLKLMAFCLSGAITAVAGGLYAMQLHSAPLANIDILTSETILIMAILGGRRSLIGAAFGALALTLMGEQLSQLWPRWQMIVGFVLIALVLYAPSGLNGLWLRLLSRRAVATPEAAKAKVTASHKEMA
jgi:branched-chain amino acid transport system permease protein